MRAHARECVRLNQLVLDAAAVQMIDYLPTTDGRELL